MQINVLSNKSVFCCDCQISDQAIAVGILCINWGTANDSEELIDHTTGEKYLIELPQISTPTYKQKLTRL